MLLSQTVYACKSCKSNAFMLALQPDFKGEVTGKLTPNGDFVMRVTFKDGSEQSFIADLLFMNQFAVCSHCNCLGQWQLAQ